MGLNIMDINVFYSTFTNVFFLFLSRFLRFLTFFIFLSRFLHLWFTAQLTRCNQHAQAQFNRVQQYSDKKKMRKSESSRNDKISDSDRSAKPNRNAKYDLCKFYFTNTVVNAWNSVSSYVAKLFQKLT